MKWIRFQKAVTLRGGEWALLGSSVSHGCVLGSKFYELVVRDNEVDEVPYLCYAPQRILFLVFSNYS